MPRHLGVVPAAKAKALEMGYEPYYLSEWIQAEAREAGRVIGNIAQSIENRGEPFEPPCVLLTTGELLVTVGQEKGVGGRNQEYALAAALTIADRENIVMAGVDTDGTDGPGGFAPPDAEWVHCLSGGIVDGETVTAAAAAGIDIHAALNQHSTSDVLWRLKSGIVATQNISLTDLGVTLIMGRDDRRSQRT
jgi:glycerate-2-kinase